MTEHILEKHRPRRLEDIVGQEECVRILKGLAAQGPDRFPSLLMEGPPGSGKTTAAHAIARAMLGSGYADNFREMNASSDRGIDVVRNEIVPWVDRMPLDGAPFKMLFLDEFDNMTPAAQAALRRPMEESSDTTRFVLACNKPALVIDPIRSRCLPLRFRQLSPVELRDILGRVAAAEGLETDGRIDTAVRHSRGDARRAIQMFVDGESDGGRYERLDKEIMSLFDTGQAVMDRVERFDAFLKTEGFSEWEEVCESIADAARADGLISDQTALRQFIQGLGQTAFRCCMVGMPLFQIRCYLVGALK